MSILIRGINPKKYTLFKAKAIENGLKIGEALERAMEEWIEHQDRIHADDTERLQNLVSLRRIKRSLGSQHEGSWIVIAKGELQLIATNLPELQQKLREMNFQWNHAFIFQLGKPVHKRTLGIGRKGDL